MSEDLKPGEMFYLSSGPGEYWERSLRHSAALGWSTAHEALEEIDRLRENVHMQINRRRDEHSKMHDAVAECDKLREENRRLSGRLWTLAQLVTCSDVLGITHLPVDEVRKVAGQVSDWEDQ